MTLVYSGPLDGKTVYALMAAVRARGGLFNNARYMVL